MLATLFFLVLPLYQLDLALQVLKRVVVGRASPRLARLRRRLLGLVHPCPALPPILRLRQARLTRRIVDTLSIVHLVIVVLVPGHNLATFLVFLRKLLGERSG